MFYYYGIKKDFELNMDMGETYTNDIDIILFMERFKSMALAGYFDKISTFDYELDEGGKYGNAYKVTAKIFLTSGVPFSGSRVLEDVLDDLCYNYGYDFYESDEYVTRTIEGKIGKWDVDLDFLKEVKNKTFASLDR